GCALGLVLGVGVIPVTAMGPGRTWDQYRQWADLLLRPALAQGEDQLRAKELTEVTATDSQAFLAIIHNSMYPDPYQRPRVVAPWVRLVHCLIGGVLTLTALWAAGWRRPEARTAEALFLGLLVILMMLLSPVCHLHYFCLSIPLVMGLIVTVWQR